ncbi:hypothetical protein Tco_1246229, partial [Tanacetum coccineum]
MFRYVVIVYKKNATGLQIWLLLWIGMLTLQFINSYNHTSPDTTVQQTFPVHEVHTPPNIVVQRTFPVHEVLRRENRTNVRAATGRRTSVRRSDLWRELRNQVAIEAVQQTFPVHEVHTRPNIVVQRTFPVHEVLRRENRTDVRAATGRRTSVRRSDLWRELRNRVATEGSHTTACRQDIRPNKDVRRRLMTSDSGIPAASGRRNSHEEIAICVDAGIPTYINPVKLQSKMGFTTNFANNSTPLNSQNVSIDTPGAIWAQAQ